MCTPTFGFAHWILVADDHRCIDICEEALVIFVGCTSHEESDVAFRAGFFNIGQSLIEKRVMAQVCMWKVFNACEVGDTWKAKRVGDVDGFVERVVVAATLSALHPVDNALAACRCASATHGDASVACQIAQCRWNTCIARVLLCESCIRFVFFLRVCLLHCLSHLLHATLCIARSLSSSECTPSRA
jgi:hypothetical protein